MSAINDRFFDSINYRFAEQVGLSFLEYKKVEDVWIYTLLKSKPWTFHDYLTFSMALEFITTYKYRIQYAYSKAPEVNDAINLFQDWYEYTNFAKHKYVISAKNDAIYFTFKSEEEALDSRSVLYEFG